MAVDPPRDGKAELLARIEKAREDAIADLLATGKHDIRIAGQLIETITLEYPDR